VSPASENVICFRFWW